MRYWIVEWLDTRSVAQLLHIRDRAARLRRQPKQLSTPMHGVALRELADYVAGRVNATHAPEAGR